MNPHEELKDINDDKSMHSMNTINGMEISDLSGKYGQPLNSDGHQNL
jgi:hypothetical protein